MRQYCIYLSIIFLLSCKNQTNTHTGKTASYSSADTTEVIENKPVTTEQEIDGNNPVDTTEGFKDFIRYNVKDTIVEDFNGVHLLDKAFFKKATSHRQLFILDGKTKDVLKVGTDSSFEGIGDDFDWVDFWGLTKDKVTYEIEVIDGEVAGSKDVDLFYPSLVLRKEEVGGGIVTYKGKGYKWVHQAD